MRFKGLVFAAVIGATALCMGASGGCGTALHKAEATAAGIAATLNTAATTNHNNTLETPAERALVASYIDAAAKSNDTFIGVLSAAESNGGVVDTAAVLAAFNDLNAKIIAFQNEGILGIKSTQAQADFAVAISSLQAALAAIEADYPPATSDGRQPRRKHSSAPLFALALTAEEIEELIALAIAAGSSLVPKLLSLVGATDAELISQAQASDASAESVAQEDMAASAPTVTAQVPETPGS